jgi:flagellar hook-associated protein 2
MSSAGISFGGLASGLDTKAIISALVAIEERPIRALEAKKTSFTKQKSMFGDLKGLLDKLSTAATALKTTTDFLKMKAASDDEDILTASASSSATPGTYTMRVTALAKAQVNSSSGSASPTASLGGPASLQIDIGGDTHLITVGDAQNPPSLQSIASAINAYDDANEMGVRAEVVDTGNTAGGGAQRYQLVVRSAETGVDGAFTITPDDGDAAFQAVINDVNANVRTPASNATIVVNGAITIQRSSNQISDLFGGLTLDLKSIDTTKDVTVTVSTDAEETAKKVQEFVDAYNKVVDFFTSQSELDAEGKAKSPLFGDSTLRSMRTSLRSVLGASVDTGNQSFQLLSQLGITSDKGGKLTFNRSKFEEALADDETAVARVFTEATNGIAGKLVAQIKVYTDSVDGLIKNRNDTFDRQVKDTQSRIESAERRLGLYEKQLESKYANLEQLLSRLQSQGSSVGNIAQRF